MNKLGPYWSVMHRRAEDYDFFKRLNPTVVKVMDGGDVDYQWIRANLPNTMVLARDWALSEQHDDMRRDPVGTGKRHAQEWAQHAQRLGFDRAKTLVLGINEPRIWEQGIPAAVTAYTVALCDECARLGLRAGALQFSVGWPANTGHDTPPDWTPYAPVQDAIRRGNHALILHEYWANEGPGEMWGWWAGRSLKCPWDVPLVIGECGIDLYVKDASVGQHRRGWQAHVAPERYAQDLREYVVRMSADKRFVGACVFAADYANNEWQSFDLKPAYDAIIATPFPDFPDTHTVYLPTVGGPTGTVTGPKAGQMPALVHPVLDARFRAVTQPYGANGGFYKQFAVDGVPLRGHNGIDFATPLGSQVVAVAEGRVVEAADDAEGYGRYIKLAHPWGESLYAHLSEQLVSVGQTVQQAQPLGRSGSSGNSTGPHLHFGLRVAPFDRRDGMGGFTDPLPYLTQSSAQPTQPAGVWPILQEAALEFGVDKYLLASLIWAESSFRPDAVSSAGAKGLGQLMPATWEEWAAVVGAANPFDARDNARTSAAYLAWLLRTLGNEWAALHAFVWGIGNVLAGKQPPDEAVDYAVKIIHGRDLLKAVVG